MDERVQCAEYGVDRLSIEDGHDLSDRHFGISAGLRPHGRGVDVLRSFPQPGLEDGDSVRHPLDAEKSGLCQSAPRKPLGNRPEFVVTQGQKFPGKQTVEMCHVADRGEVPKLES